MNVDLILKALSLALPILGAGYTWFATRRKDIDVRLDAGSKRMDQHDLEIQSLQQTVASLPAKEDVHRIELAMMEMTGELKTIGAHISGQREVMRRIETINARHEEHLINGGKGL